MAAGKMKTFVAWDNLIIVCVLRCVDLMALEEQKHCSGMRR